MDRQHWAKVRSGARGRFLCEMFLRLESVGLTYGFSCDFPPTEPELAEATGLTTVHVNRTLQDLRRNGLIELFEGER